MNNQSNTIRRFLSITLCLVILFGTLGLNRNQSASAASGYDGEALALSSGIKLEGVNLSLYTDGRIGVILHFSGINGLAVNRGYVSIDGSRYIFVATENRGEYDVIWHVYPKDFFGTYDVSVYDLYNQIPLANESAVNGTVSFSIDDIIDKSYELSEDSKVKSILSSLRTYTNCASNYFYTEREPKTADVDSVDLKQYALTQSGSLMGFAQYYGSSIVLDDSITIKHYFTVSDWSLLDTDDVKKNLKTTIDGTSVSAEKSGDFMVFSISNIDIWDLDHFYDLCVSHKYLGMEYHLKYSVLSYAYTTDVTNGENTLISKLVRSMYWYFKAVKEYIEAGGTPDTPSPDNTYGIELPESPYGKTPITYVYPTISPDANVDGYVTYSMFGAKGDGKTDDYAAIVSTHDYANEHHLPVKADSGATYYISFMDPKKNNGMGAVIKTETDWTGATFIIDDRCLTAIQNDSNDKINLFTVASYQSEMKVISTFKYLDEAKTIRDYTLHSVGEHTGEKWFDSITAGQINLDTHFDTDVLLKVMDHQNSNFVRTGIETPGKPCQESIIVYKDGTVDPEAPITYDYPTITEYHAYPIDADTLTVTGGTFITVVKASAKATDEVKIIYRGIQVQRSNTVLDGITHYRIEGYDPSLASEYMGFIRVINCCNVTIQNSNLSSHSSDHRPGSYDLYYEHAINVHLENVREVTDILAEKRFGIMGANWVKNVSANNCFLNRFDVHRGTTNATITNSIIGIAGIRLTGCGTALIENTTVYHEFFVRLREDYGGSWDGDLIIKNCTWYPGVKKNNTGLHPLSPLQLIWTKNIGNTDYGYETALPNVYVTDLDIIPTLGFADSEYNAMRQKGLRIFAVYSPAVSYDAWNADPSVLGEHRPKLPEVVSVQNVNIYGVQSKSGMPIYVVDPDHSFEFNNLQITGDTVMIEK